MKTRTKFILWSLPLLLIILTCLYIFVVGNRLNVPWKFVGKPSENISKIIGYNVSVDKLYVCSDTGEMYSFGYLGYYNEPVPQPSDWIKDGSYKKELDPVYKSGYVPLAVLSPPQPFKAKQIYQIDHRETESTSVTKLALSEDGNLWSWGVGFSGLQGYIYFLILAAEVLAYAFALFVYFAILLTKKVIRNFNLRR
jgi:hypothetical protein